jgi:hypothetical protein
MKKIEILALAILIIVLVACNNTENTTAAKTDYTIAGDSIATAAQIALISELTTAMNEGGTVKAISFCNENAQNIKAELSEKYNCTIQRISEKYRNPKDKPESPTDKKVLLAFSAAHNARNTIAPKLIEESNEVIYYKPIMVAMPTCLKCHGSKTTDIDVATQEIIDAKYPNDLATGYNLGDFRGAWKITFKQ